MKKIIIVFVLLAQTFSVFSQQAHPSQPLTREDYLKKSRKQKTAAWLLLSGGFTCIVIGSVLSADLNVNGDNYGSVFDEKTSKAGSVLSVVGLCSMAGSIPLFIAAHRNKKKGINLSFENKRARQIQNASFVYRPLPSLTLKISL
jgi:hypothetical protein